MGNAKSADRRDVDESATSATTSTVPHGRTKKPCQQPKRHHNASARSSISSQGNRRPLLSANQRIIIKYCLDNARDDIGDRILRRVIEKRDDFQQFLDNVSKAQKSDIADALKRFLLRVCDSLTDADEMVKVSEEFGCSHVQFRTCGFKPDYFACTADAVTTECTFLDQATHTASETASSWSQLSAFVFSAVRDGYYAELRRQRKSSTAFRNRISIDIISSATTATDDGVSSSLGNDSNRRSTSPLDDLSSSHDEMEPIESSGNFLAPPQVY